MPTWALLVAAVMVLLVAAKPAFATKPGAALSTHGAIVYARDVVARVWRRFGYVLTVTSGLDGSHSSQSQHYAGLAEDYRTRDVDGINLTLMVAEVRSILGRDYDVILESDHLHVEYDPS
jgi:hypothetical protein